jgi:hypothetical protein
MRKVLIGLLIHIFPIDVISSYFENEHVNVCACVLDIQQKKTNEHTKNKCTVWLLFFSSTSLLFKISIKIKGMMPRSSIH